MTQHNQPIIILIYPQLGENIGMVARAMRNCQFSELRIVDPRDGWPNPTAFSASAGADDILHQAKIYNHLNDAIADCHYILGLTARKRGRALPRYDLEQAVQEMMQQTNQQNMKTALLFGAERAGLDNHAISLCNGLVHINLNPDFQSLNLSQAVLLFCYHYRIQNLACTDETLPHFMPASRDELLNFLTRLEQSLDVRGFFKTKEQKPEMLKNLTHYFIRSAASAQELKTLHGIIERLQKPPHS